MIQRGDLSSILECLFQSCIIDNVKYCNNDSIHCTIVQLRFNQPKSRILPVHLRIANHYRHDNNSGIHIIDLPGLDYLRLMVKIDGKCIHTIEFTPNDCLRNIIQEAYAKFIFAKK